LFPGGSIVVPVPSIQSAEIQTNSRVLTLSGQIVDDESFHWLGSFLAVRHINQDTSILPLHKFVARRVAMNVESFEFDDLFHQVSVNAQNLGPFVLHNLASLTAKIIM
jgi:hypothetical protein